ncbi:MAG: PepSY-associated TM helix domain-containing protein [Porticoccaceae bacterium]|nr:PepSY-associated TM helix domain-containing protein [Porticoccaceae bacterium]MDG1474480.1 PepSY-associated TM helix domain-containing protein [Porticoccaceae bacterium]
MRTSTLLRKIHYWGSFSIALPLIIMIGAGILLMVKKEFDWIQPPSQKGSERQLVPMASMQDLFDAASTVEVAEFTRWDQLQRADLKPGKGIIKFVSKTDWEVQIDTHTTEVLSVAQRRSDVIESIHDGSFFADWVKLWVFLPAGVGLFVLWVSGIYLFTFTEYKKRRNHRR